MKSSVKLSIIAVISILTVFGLIFAFTQPITASSYFEKLSLDDKTVRIQTTSANPVMDIQLLENTEQCLVDCYAILKIHPYSDIRIPASSDSDFRWDFLKARKGMPGLKAYSFQILATTEYTEDVPAYGNVSYPCENNETREPSTCWRVEQTGSTKVTKQKAEYIPFRFFGETFAAGRDYYLKVSGEKYIGNGGNDIDWVPTIEGVRINEWNWWNGSWQKRRPITINVSDGLTLSNYQVLMNITYNSSMKADFGDLRFASNGSGNAAELDYYIVEKVNSSFALVFVEVDSINTTIYMYYDYDNAQTTSNGTSTFLWFDGWEDNSLSEYTQYIQSNPGSALEISSLTKKEGSKSLRRNTTYEGNQAFIIDRSLPTYNTTAQPLIIEGWVNESSEPGSGNGQFMGYFMGENASDYCETGIVTAATYQGDLYFRIVVGGVTKLNNYSQDGLSDNTWYWLKTIWNNTMTIEVYDKLNGTLLKAATNASARCNCTRIGVGGVRRSYADTSWARKTHNPEPVYSIGNEESNSLANEEGGRSAILEGIGISLGGFSYDTYADRQIYARNASDSQKQGKFDEVVVLGNQTWAFNYIPPTDNTNPQTWMFNITPVLYVWEYGNKTYEEIINSVSALINSTKL